jgi:hypothetical protein
VKVKRVSFFRPTEAKAKQKGKKMTWEELQGKKRGEKKGGQTQNIKIIGVPVFDELFD